MRLPKRNYLSDQRFGLLWGYKKVSDQCPSPLVPGIDRIRNMTLVHPGFLLTDHWICKWITMKVAQTQLAYCSLSRDNAWAIPSSWLYHCPETPWHYFLRYPLTTTLWRSHLNHSLSYYTFCCLIYYVLKLFIYFWKHSLEHKLPDGRLHMSYLLL